MYKPALRPKHMYGLATTLVLLIAGGCSNKPYLVTFNEQVVYSPNQALVNPVFFDPALQGCLNQLLSGDSELEVEAIRIFACPEAGIRNMRGIRAMRSLEQLELSGNEIDNISELQPLRNLRVLSLRNNRIGNIGPLSRLPLLRFVSLEGNDGIPCQQLDELGARLSNTLNRPQDCVR
jgi:Leucine-rich repeat (LRR) protein